MTRLGRMGDPALRRRWRPWLLLFCSARACFESGSLPGAGTEIALTIPVAAAYRESGTRRRWGPLRFMVGGQR